MVSREEYEECMRGLMEWLKECEDDDGLAEWLEEQRRNEEMYMNDYIIEYFRGTEMDSALIGAPTPNMAIDIFREVMPDDYEIIDVREVTR